MPLPDVHVIPSSKTNPHGSPNPNSRSNPRTNRHTNTGTVMKLTQSQSYPSTRNNLNTYDTRNSNINFKSRYQILIALDNLNPIVVKNKIIATRY